MLLLIGVSAQKWLSFYSYTISVCKYDALDSSKSLRKELMAWELMLKLSSGILSLAIIESL